MIPQNLKVGDKFKDGNSTYEVLEIVELGYTSKRISVDVQDAPVSVQKATEQPIENEVVESSTTYTKTEINRLNNKELEALCDKLGLEKDTGVLMKKKIIDHLGL